MDCYVQLEGEFPYEFVLSMDSTVSYLFCIVNICFVCITYSPWQWHHCLFFLPLLQNQSCLLFCSLRLTFFVRKKDGTIVAGIDIMYLLRDKLDSNIILSYPIVSLDTVCESVILCFCAMYKQVHYTLNVFLRFEWQTAIGQSECTKEISPFTTSFISQFRIISFWWTVTHWRSHVRHRWVREKYLCESCGVFSHPWMTAWQRSCVVCSGCGHHCREHFKWS